MPEQAPPYRRIVARKVSRAARLWQFWLDLPEVGRLGLLLVGFVVLAFVSG